MPCVGLLSLWDPCLLDIIPTCSINSVTVSRKQTTDGSPLEIGRPVHLHVHFPRPSHGSAPREVAHFPAHCRRGKETGWVCCAAGRKRGDERPGSGSLLRLHLGE